MKKFLVLLFLLATINTSYGALTDNLQGYWKMENTNEELGTYPLTGTGAPGSTAGIIGNARSYAGGTSRDSFNFTSALPAGSFSLWFNYSSVNANYGRLFSKTQSGVTDAIVVGINSTNNINVQIQDTVIYTGTTTLSTNTTYHLVVTWDGSNVITYINGIPINITASVKTLQANARPIFLGGTDVNTQGITGWEDEVGLWSRALSASEVTQLYNNGKGFQYPFTSANTTLMFFRFAKFR